MPDGITTAEFPRHAFVLNPDHTPVSFPHFTVKWWRAIQMVELGTAYRLRESGFVAHSPSISLPVPRIIVLHRFYKVVELYEPAPFSLENLFLRDRGRCMYTDRPLKLRSNDPELQASFDHILPKSRGGKRSWENSVLTSAALNTWKGNRTPEEVRLRQKYPAWEPTRADLLKLRLSIEGLQGIDEDLMEYIDNVRTSRRVQRVLVA